MIYFSVLIYIFLDFFIIIIYYLFYYKTKLKRILRLFRIGPYSKDTCGLIIDLIIGLKHHVMPMLTLKT
jgi:uncharacterized membrane protein SirB2